ncbi:hypothetical protein [Streptomyces aureocirculatus]|uniref:hypothetical protein n=1 Tax=Streptomyces aureocirculatus TaxID=67275 RepID=UPI000B0286F0|nr:hypothetical protein [Streptomyces aureocirculatus]
MSTESKHDPAVDLIQNKVSGKCLARLLSDDLYMATCTGGASPRWHDYATY